MTRSPEEITQLLLSSREGDPRAMEELLELVYADLRQLAARQLRREGPENTLSATVLVHEAYLRLAGEVSGRFNDRQHFFRLIARAMRRIAIDHARRRLALKRGGDEQRTTWDDDKLRAGERAAMVVEMEEALEQLRESEPRLVQVVECRFYAGLTEAETAAAMDCSRRTVQRDWEQAREKLKSLLAD